MKEKGIRPNSNLCQSTELPPLHDWRRAQEERVKLNWNSGGNPPSDGTLNHSSDELAGLDLDGLVI